MYAIELPLRISSIEPKWINDASDAPVATIHGEMEPMKAWRDFLIHACNGHAKLTAAMAEALNAIEGLEAKDRGQTAAIRYATRVLKDAITEAKLK